MKKTLAIVIVLLCVYGDVYAILPDRVYIRRPDSLGLKYRDLDVKTKDGYNIKTWFFSAQQDQNDKKITPRPTIIICNGDAGNMSYFQLYLAQAYTSQGFNVVTFDWRGFGESTPFDMDRNYLCYTEMLEDYRAVIQNVHSQKEVKKDEIIVMGWSTGAYLSMITAYDNKNVSAFIGRSLCTDFDDFIPLVMQVKNKTKDQLIVPKDFPINKMPVYIASKFKKPIFLINGDKDLRTPVSMSEKVLSLLPKNAKRELMIVPEAAHGGMQDPIIMDFDNFIIKSSSFLRKNL